ncbi:unnamed protein product [Schistosoma intercalatum]|nr:unnamed protein product [Schistosoma intercalatum]
MLGRDHVFSYILMRRKINYDYLNSMDCKQTNKNREIIDSCFVLHSNPSNVGIFNAVSLRRTKSPNFCKQWGCGKTFVIRRNREWSLIERGGIQPYSR